MAGSYQHCIDDNGDVHNNEAFRNHIENLGDAYEACEMMVHMIGFLAKKCAGKNPHYASLSIDDRNKLINEYISAAQNDFFITH